MIIPFLHFFFLDQNKYDSIICKFYRSSIAQLVEQRTVNPFVPGSSPGRGAIFLVLNYYDFKNNFGIIDYCGR